MDLAKMTLDTEQHIDIARPKDVVFEGLIEQFTTGMQYPDGTSMNHKMERWPGGRWYRDLGDNTGHLWGIVQSFKPGALLEVTGPLFMSYPVANHLEVKLSDHEGGTRVSLRHRAFGLLDENHVKGVSQGWGGMMTALKATLEA